MKYAALAQPTQERGKRQHLRNKSKSRRNAPRSTLLAKSDSTEISRVTRKDNGRRLTISLCQLIPVRSNRVSQQHFLFDEDLLRQRCRPRREVEEGEIRRRGRHLGDEPTALTNVAIRSVEVDPTISERISVQTNLEDLADAERRSDVFESTAGRVVADKRNAFRRF